MEFPINGAPIHLLNCGALLGSVTLLGAAFLVPFRLRVADGVGMSGSRAKEFFNKQQSRLLRQSDYTGAEPASCPLQALAVLEAGALSDLDNVTVRIADVAANLAVLGDRSREKLGSPTFP